MFCNAYFIDTLLMIRREFDEIKLLESGLLKTDLFSRPLDVHHF